MPRVHVFPFGITLRGGGVIDVFPAAEVIFGVGKGERISLFLIIDSGATISALPKSDATMLGMDAERGTVMMVSGVGGYPLKGWRHEVVIDLGGDAVRIPLVFLDDDSAPRVLGRTGIFDRYTIIFEEHKRRSILVNTQTNIYRRITKIIDGIRR